MSPTSSSSQRGSRYLWSTHKPEGKTGDAVVGFSWIPTSPSERDTLTFSQGSTISSGFWVKKGTVIGYSDHMTTTEQNGSFVDAALRAVFMDQLSNESDRHDVKSGAIKLAEMAPGYADKACKLLADLRQDPLIRSRIDDDTVPEWLTPTITPTQAIGKMRSWLEEDVPLTEAKLYYKTLDTLMDLLAIPPADGSKVGDDADVKSYAEEMRPAMSHASALLSEIAKLPEDRQVEACAALAVLVQDPSHVRWERVTPVFGAN